MASFARLRAVVLDTPDPLALAGFYQGLLGGEIRTEDDEPGWVDLVGGSLKVSFQLATDHQPPVWGDPAHPQQLHLDLTVADIEAAEADVLALGARKHETQPGADSGWRVYLDPSGHPFCLCWD